MGARRRGLHLRRRGASSLELQVSFVVFSMAMVGLFPVASSYQRLGNALDRDVRHFQRGPLQSADEPPEHWLVPASASWAARLNGVPAADMFVPASNEGLKQSVPDVVKIVVDDMDAEAEFVGEWVQAAAGGFGGGHHAVEAGDGTQSATWTIAELTPGRPYWVYVTWPGAEGQGTPTITSANTAKTYDPDAGSFGEGVTEPGLDQSAAPRADLTTDDGLDWQRLSNVYAPNASGEIQITLAAPADGKKVVADAVRVAPLDRAVTWESTSANPDDPTVQVMTVTVK